MVIFISIIINLSNFARLRLLGIAFLVGQCPLVASADWDIDVSDSHVIASISGNVTFGEKQRFIFFKNDCEFVGHLFSKYTTAPGNIEELKGEVFVIEFNEDKIGARLSTATKAMGGHLLMFELGMYDKEALLRHLQPHSKISLVFVDGNGIKASDYFDIPHNEWQISGMSGAFEEAYSACANLSR